MESEDQLNKVDQRSGRPEPVLDRRLFLKALGTFSLAALLELLEKKGSLPRVSATVGERGAHSQEIKTVAPEWEILGPPITIGSGEEPDGIRASSASQDGNLILAATWQHGVWAFRGGSWEELPVPPADEQNRPYGVNRHILMIEKGLVEEYAAGLRSVMIVDQGVQVVKEEADGELQVLSWHFPEVPEGFLLDFAQTGCLVDTDSRRELFIGGMGGIVRVDSWERNEIRWQPIWQIGEPPRGEPKIMVRTIVVDPQNPDFMMAGGWWGYSGWESCTKEEMTNEVAVKREGGRIKPGAGIWKSEDRGATWCQVLADINVNCLLIHPSNPNIIIAGTEGAGEDVTRNPNPEFPSLFISLDRGESWQPFAPQPWRYDLVTPQQAFVYLEQEKKLLISFWGGPVMEVEFPPDLTPSQLGSLKWRILTPSDPNDPFSREGYYGGHLSSFQQAGRRRIATGSYTYWTDTPPFTPLRSTSLRTNEGKIWSVSLPRLGK